MLADELQHAVKELVHTNRFRRQVRADSDGAELDDTVLQDALLLVLRECGTLEKLNVALPDEISPLASREIISWEAFESVFREVARAAFGSRDIPAFKGHRVTAIDTVTVALRDAPELRERFGAEDGRCFAQMSLLTDCFCGAVYSAQIDSAGSEASLAAAETQQLAALMESTGYENILLVDRELCSQKMLSYLLRHGIHFLMRTCNDFWCKRAVTDALAGEYVTMNYGSRPYRFRVVRLPVSGDRTEILFTDMYFCDRSELYSLYMMRWQDKPDMGRLCQKYFLGSVSGQNEAHVMQDIFTLLIAANLNISNAMSLPRTGSAEEVS